MNFTMTRSAQRFIRMMIMADGGTTSGFRMHVTPGGCSGLNADIAVLPEPRPGDAVVEKDGLKLFLPAESRLLLDGVTVDFTETATSGGLVFHDPKGVKCSH